jgi:hypothetical protein
VLTELQEQLAEAHALAIAAAAVTRRVEERIRDRELALDLAARRGDADDTRARCLAVEESFGKELGNELLARVNTRKEKAQELANAWFKAGTGPLAAWTFLTMGEAAEVAVWSAVGVLARDAGHAALRELAEWALPIQQRHLETALGGAVRLAGFARARG